MRPVYLRGRRRRDGEARQRRQKDRREQPPPPIRPAARCRRRRRYLRHRRVLPYQSCERFVRILLVRGPVRVGIVVVVVVIVASPCVSVYRDAKFDQTKR